MKIIFFIDTLQSGGAARVICSLSNELVTRGHEVKIATNTIHRKISYKLDDKVKILSLYAENFYTYPILYRIYILFKYGRKIAKIEQPDIVVGVTSFFLIAKFAVLGTKVPVVASDHTSFFRKLPWYYNFLRFHLYNIADAVTILTQADYQYLGKRLPKKIVIPNPLSYPIFKEKSVREKCILAVGRIDVWEVKGFDLLIKTWAKLANRHKDWVLKIVGTGNEKSFQDIKAIAIKSGVMEQIIFEGYRSDIEIVMRNSAVFVLSSRIEGFPMVIIEAMSQGCACVSFRIHGAIQDIITDNQSGLLVNDGDVEQLAEKIELLISNEDLREKLGIAAKTDVSRFKPSVITDKWEQLFYKLLNMKSK